MRRSSLWIPSPLVLAAVWLADCGKSGDSDRITIGLAVPSLSHPFFIYLRDHVMDEARALGVKVIGGTSLMGGRGGVIGTFVGALLIGTINNAMNLLGVSPYWQLVAKGAIIVAAALLDRLREN